MRCVGVRYEAGGRCISVASVLLACFLLVLMALPVMGQDDSSLFTQARTLYEAKHYPEAAAIWKSIADASSSETACEAAYWYAKALHAIGTDYKAAKAAFLSVQERWPNSDDARAAVLSAGYSALMYDDTEAAGLFQRVAKDYPGTTQCAEAKLRLGYLAVRHKDLAGAAEWYWGAASDTHGANSDRTTAYIQYGFTAIMEFFQDSREKLPTASQRLATARERLEQTIDFLDSQPGRNAEAAFCQVGIAESYLWDNKLSEAETAYKQALSNHGDLPLAVEMLARHGLGVTLFREGAQDDARAQLVGVSGIAGKSPAAALSIPVDFLRFDAGVLNALILWRQGKYPEALTAIEPFASEAETKAYKDGRMAMVGAQALICQGRILESLGRKEEAAVSLKKVVALYLQASDHAALAAKMLKDLTVH